jgi:hypothetical protein
MQSLGLWASAKSRPTMLRNRWTDQRRVQIKGTRVLIEYGEVLDLVDSWLHASASRPSPRTYDSSDTGTMRGWVVVGLCGLYSMETFAFTLRLIWILVAT